MIDEFQKLQRELSPQEVEKLRKLNRTLAQCETYIRDFALKNHLQEYCIELISSSIKEEERWDKIEELYFGHFGMSDFYFPDKYHRACVLRGLLHEKKSHPMLGYYLFETPLTIDNLLAADTIHAYIFHRYSKVSPSEAESIRFVYDASTELWRDANQGECINI